MLDKQQIMKLNPLTVGILLALPVVAHSANIQMVNGHNIASTNGVPVIDINQANSNGISHNIYDRLNVGREGLIFNNSQNGANTVLAGQIAGNANLASGTASVILNEVTSRNASTLNGMMEVAGDKAQVIIANPNGITCNDCGFINSDSVTLTTGTPDLVNGELKGYSVNGGIITTNGLKSDSPTAILARSVVVNGDLQVDGELNVVVGNNYVDTHNNVTGSVQATGSRNAYSIDVAKLGGMYADKINLVSTENGVGVRNLGRIVGQSGGIKIDTNGRLVNNNAEILSAGNVAIKTNGTLENTTGQIVAGDSISVDTNKYYVSNNKAGKIEANNAVQINSGRIDNTNGYIAGNSAVQINTNNNELVNNGKGTNVGISGGDVVLNTAKLNNYNGQIQGDNVSTNSNYLYNLNGQIQAQNDLNITSTGALDNTNGLLSAVNGGVDIVAVNSTLYNKKTDTSPQGSTGIVAGNGGISISVANLENYAGYIQTEGDVDLAVSHHINNTYGSIYADGDIDIQSKVLTNNQSNIIADQNVNIDLKGDISNYLSYISAKNGDVSIGATNINNNGGVITGENIDLDAMYHIYNAPGLISANKALTVNAGHSVQNLSSEHLTASYGKHLGLTDQDGGMYGKDGVTINTLTLNNTKGKIIAEQGDIKIESSHGLYNDLGTINANGDIDIQSKFLTGNQSKIIADQNVNINLKGDMTNYLSYVTAKNGDVSIDAANINNNGGVITGKNIDLDADYHIYNAPGLISATDRLTVNAGHSVQNLSSEHFATSYGKHLDLEGQNGGMYGRNGIVINSLNLNNTKGHIISDLGAINIDLGHDLHNDHGLIRSGNSNLVPNRSSANATTIKAGHKISNNYGTIYSTGNMALESDVFYMAGGGSTIQGNATGFIVANGALDITVRKGDVHNYGWIVGKEKLTMNVNGYLKNLNTIYSDKDADITAGQAIYNFQNILSGRTLNLVSGSYIKNGGTIYSDGRTSIDGTYIYNTSYGSILGGGQGLDLNNTQLMGYGLVFGL